MIRQHYLAVLITLSLLATLGWGFTRSDLRVPTPVDSAGYADSAGTVSDGSIGTAQFDATGVLDFLSPGLRLFSDSLVVSTAYCGYHLWDSLGSQPETAWIACAVITDECDKENTIILSFPYACNHTMPLGGSTAASFDAAAGPILGPTASPYGEGGFYLLRRVHYWQIPGHWYVVLRFTTPP